MIRKDRTAAVSEEERRIPAARHRVYEFVGLAVLIALYVATSIAIPRLSRSAATIAIGNSRLPVTAFAGVLSSLGNICIICIVVFYRRPGFILALGLMMIQFPFLILNIFVRQNPISLPGFFSNLLTIIAICLIRSRNKQILKYQAEEVKQLTERQVLSQQLFEQTATALVTAIDAKDEYSHGHSIRVAEYSQRIARAMGKGDEECRQIYYAGLLHDVGKLGISDSIINKKGVLTPQENAEIQKHPVMGDQILSGITDHPYLSLAARHHHEWYDGTGYPDGLKGKQIPEIARIISVADAYDTMSSNRSYRRAIPQQIIREEIVAGAGTQFDPEMAMIMRHMIDQDSEYRMQEKNPAKKLGGDHTIRCGVYRSAVSDGIILNRHMTKIHLFCRRMEDDEAYPALILFDSLDGCVHEDEKAIRELNYDEYCEIRLNGETENHSAREIRTVVKESGREKKDRNEFDLEALKCRDHVLIRIDDGRKLREVTIALQDSSRYAYLALTGQNCVISEIRIEKSPDEAPDESIARIAEEISYIDGPEGDIPNIQIDSIRSASTAGIPVTDGMRLTFHTMSLPTARLIWHCPYIVLFHSANGAVNGEDYREYVVVRLDGEGWDTDGPAENRITFTREDDFRGWEAWKQENKAGIDCVVDFAWEGNTMTVCTTNLGLAVKGVTKLPDLPEGKETVYAALTGDQCAITNIRIKKQ